MSDEIREHNDAIEACNQRGGRMLSIVDLIDAGTLTAELAAYSFAAIGKGASFMVGALPGGAGKTTVMGALLNFVPAGVPLIAADSLATIEQGLNRRDRKTCYICHEIGDGGYYAYLWGEELRAFFRAARDGHMLATNLHADTIEEARGQICGENGVPQEDFFRMNLCFFLAVGGSRGRPERRITEVWESDGTSPHRRVFPSNGPSKLVDLERVARARLAIDRLVDGGVRTIEDVRAALVRIWGQTPIS